MGIVFLHLVACCVALGLVFTSDVAMIKGLLRPTPDAQDEEHLTHLHKTISRALLVLWLTGIGLVSFDILAKGVGTLANPKLQSKIALVVLLTLNGMVLQRQVMPFLHRAGSLMKLTFPRRMVALFVGSVSGVSWFYAALLGIGRPLNWKYSLTEILMAYPFLIVGGFVGMVFLTAWAEYQGRQAVRTTEPADSWEILPRPLLT
ncbi:MULTISPECIES: hypothetical protein [Ramlibacter]|nr:MULTISPECIES: hypothetical protein [Ramlibacter]